MSLLSLSRKLCTELPSRDLGTGWPWWEGGRGLLSEHPGAQAENSCSADFPVVIGKAFVSACEFNLDSSF